MQAQGEHANSWQVVPWLGLKPTTVVSGRSATVMPLLKSRKRLSLYIIVKLLLTIFNPIKRFHKTFGEVISCKIIINMFHLPALCETVLHRAEPILLFWGSPTSFLALPRLLSFHHS